VGWAQAGRGGARAAPPPRPPAAAPPPPHRLGIASGMPLSLRTTVRMGSILSTTPVATAPPAWVWSVTRSPTTNGRVTYRLSPEIALLVTDCAPKPTARPPTPPTVSRGAGSTPTTASAVSAAAAIKAHVARPAKGTSTRSSTTALPVSPSDSARRRRAATRASFQPTANQHANTTTATRAASRNAASSPASPAAARVIPTRTLAHLGGCMSSCWMRIWRARAAVRSVDARAAAGRMTRAGARAADAAASAATRSMEGRLGDVSAAS